jgi:predicted secreted protein
MSCDANVQKGRDLVLLARNDADTEYELVGGIKSLGYTIDNPVEDTTNASTPGSFLESEWTGYSQMTVTASGMADKRTGIVDPATGLNVVGSVRLLEIANSSSNNKCGQFKILNVDTDGFIEGFFNMTSFGKTGDTPGLMNFDTTLQSKDTIIVSGDV